MISVKKASNEQLEKWTPAISEIPEEVADTLIRLYLLREQQQLVEVFLDDLQIPHTQGLIQDDFDLDTVPAEEIGNAAHRLTERFGADATGLYFNYTSMSSGPWGEAVRRISL